ncbi:hypothetical protein VP01_312g7 [Puccinia sorghi]|uniref:Reverse transcriptase domain-containing protein n=1 Tax=Puccinia sorghi TaxID=27349 RepID=A0A0L6UZ45_9BASI|nr:hypothetical protein VP01_312g7 [Puccinia sorghi]
MVENVKVQTDLMEVSDHWPVLLPLTWKTNLPPSSKKSWDRRALAGHGIELALSHKWDFLQTDNISSHKDMDLATEKWVSTLNTIWEELGILCVPPEHQQINFDKNTKVVVQAARKARIRNQLTAGLLEKQQRAKSAIKKFARHEKLKRKAIPCFNEHNTLETDMQGILRARQRYSAQLADDTDISQSRDRWDHKRPPPLTNPIPPIHITRLGTGTEEEDPTKPLDVPAMIMAIRSMKENAAPGKNGVLTAHLEKFLEIECQQQVALEWENAPQHHFGNKSYPKPLDYSATDLNRWSLPSYLITPPLQHLHRILNSCFVLKSQPKIWNEEVLITLPKPGQDPRFLANTRGITLSCTEGKLLLTIVAQEISQLLERQKFFTKAQADFRYGQETTSHVIALSEIIQRRRNDMQVTYALFVDFKKAFDRVPHEGLWVKLEQLGIHPKLIDIIKRGYQNSEIRCCIGEDFSEPFPRLIGTQQGCPLSPLLSDTTYTTKDTGKANRILFQSLPILFDKNIHPICKARTIQTYIMSAGTYGAEWVGMNQRRTRPIQGVIDKALQLSFGFKSHYKGVSPLLASIELGINPISIHCTKQRVRLWHKGPKLKTTLKDLIKHPTKGGTTKNWVQNTKIYIKKLGQQL